MAQILEAEKNFIEAADFYSKVFTNQVPDEFYNRIIHVYEMADRYENLYDIYEKQFEKNPNDIDLCERFANTCCILYRFM